MNLWCKPTDCLAIQTYANGFCLHAYQSSLPFLSSHQFAIIWFWTENETEKKRALSLQRRRKKTCQMTFISWRPTRYRTTNKIQFNKWTCACIVTLVILLHHCVNMSWRRVFIWFLLNFFSHFIIVDHFQRRHSYTFNKLLSIGTVFGGVCMAWHGRVFRVRQTKWKCIQWTRSPLIICEALRSAALGYCRAQTLII